MIDYLIYDHALTDNKTSNTLKYLLLYFDFLYVLLSVTL